jgi:hypothetical protein
MLLLLFTFLASGILLALLSIPLLLGKIPPNGLYGFRVTATLEDPQLWYAVNAFAAKRLLFAGLSICVAAGGLYFVPGLSVDTYALACLGVFMLTFIPGLVQSVLYLQTHRNK